MNSATIVVSLFFAALSFPVFSEPLPDGYDIIAVYVDEDRGRRMVVDADGKTYDCGYTLSPRRIVRRFSCLIQRSRACMRP